MNNKISVILFAFLAFSCHDSTTSENEIEPSPDIPDVEMESPNETEGDYNWDDSGATNIILKESTVEVTGDGAVFANKTVTIEKAGTYNISGSWADGQIVVDTEDADNVNLILNEAEINTSVSSAISILNAEKVVLKLAEGTENSLTDGVYDEEEDNNGALFSKTDLLIFGTGKLTVNANYKDGIVSKDGLVIENGVFEINAPDDGIRGKDYIVVHNGHFVIQAGGDGLKSDNDEDEGFGYISIDAGTFDVTAGADGFQAETVLLIEDGDFDLNTGGGSAQTIEDESSAKGLKAGAKLIVNQGTFKIDGADDALHSNQYIVVNDGEFDLSTADDAIHADEAVEINGGNIVINKSYEGLESRVLTINGGHIWVTSSDDALNVTDGTSTDGPGGFGGANGGSANAFMYIKGGYIVVNSGGDGLDANGSIEMSDGTVLVHGPSRSGNGALDYDNSFKMTGGFLVAVGSAGMAQQPDESSTQYSVLANLSRSQEAGTFFNIKTSGGEDVITFQSLKNFQSIVVSSPTFTNGGSYKLYLGGTSSGNSSDGLFLDGSYSGGTEYKSFTISSVSTHF
ncbi:carbohydrate-binding domain-containing protein [Marinilongibacter aquaticus]|uniref:carbohydrate-binding domain-containing protein n=1 Tax=Marinilongibacter aquaticus TaxID=2975157 RepID=UPI0021BCFB99|nr:carbohydrate-binding domain-containing protein [Marinilongibacter aquaticus]UBM57408.1 carbohydrate-binding domain-containing protein [Marinilongibacter aquaticus]